MLAKLNDKNLWVVDNEMYAHDFKIPGTKGSDSNFILQAWKMDDFELGSIDDFAEYASEHKGGFGPNATMLHFVEGLYMWDMELSTLTPIADVTIVQE